MMGHVIFYVVDNINCNDNIAYSLDKNSFFSVNTVISKPV